MSCYLRHLKDQLNEAGIEVKAGNRKRIDETVHQILGVPYKDCPTAWKKVKEKLQDESERRVFVERLRSALK